MFDPKERAKEIIDTFQSLEPEEQEKILSECGLSLKKSRLHRQKSYFERMFLHVFGKNPPPTAPPENESFQSAG